MDPRQHLSSLKRGLNVLAMLNRAGSLSTSQVAQMVGVPRTTAQRILETLVVEGYIERVPTSRVYRPTPTVNLLSGGFTDDSWVCHVASDVLFAKTREIGWPLCIATQLGEHMTVRLTTDRATTLALDHFQVGFRTPIMYSTSGHVMLAFSSPEKREAMLEIIRQSDDPRQALARNPEAVQHIVDKVSGRGFAHIAYAQHAEAYIGVPLYFEGEVIACVLAHYIKRAYNIAAAEEALVPVLRDLARTIEREALAMKHRIAIASRSQIAPLQLKVA